MFLYKKIFRKINIVFWFSLSFILTFLLLYLFFKALFLKKEQFYCSYLGKNLFKYQFISNKGKKISLFKNMKGHLSLLNVWTNYYDSSIEERNLLMFLSKKGFYIYGLNYKNDIYSIKKWLFIWGNPYKFIITDYNGEISIDLGIYNFPTTFLVDKNGIVRICYVGELSKKVWKTIFLPKIKSL
ncbi:redoxin family protein [Candidatus Legionella polyplacis]|uniref:Redoxin family protein n=1 Tax=Candidatus Legionella polyplacis TaxID=2005262 RepID=A0ABZ2GXG2_9GAMM